MPTVNIGSGGYVIIDGQRIPRGELSTLYTSTTLALVNGVRPSTGYTGSLSYYIKPTGYASWLDGDNSDTAFASLADLKTWMDANFENATGAGSSGTSFLGYTGMKTKIIATTPTVSTSPAYSIGDCIGGLITLTDAMRTSGGTGTLVNFLVKETGTQKAAIDIILFNAIPNGAGATYTDNAAVVFGTGDAAKIINKISITADKYTTSGGQSIATSGAIGEAVSAVGSDNLYAIMVSQGTPTYASTGAITFNASFYQD